ncbi:MAG: response regulator transcription factor [Ruminococcaceae bacterium]|nr:response regulator transcription factor [Oscillospiraceae bacterium]
MNTKVKILFCDDDKNICELARMYLEKEGFEVILASDGRQAVNGFNREKPNLIILDILMPYMDGYEVCREIRKVSSVPIIFLTAKSDTFDKVLGLELGADDYIVKPFDVKELIARIKAVLRRFDSDKGEMEKEDEVIYDNININLSNYELKINDKVVEMPPKELELLYFLAKNPNKVFTRDQLLSSVWDYDYFGDSRTVDVHIKRIREKIENKSEKWNLKTVWGVGYKFEVL